MVRQTDIKPPFTEETAKDKVKAAQDAWNSRNPELVAQAYTIDSRWRNDYPIKESERRYL